ncbi:MAG: hypothetical protein ACXVPY_08135 [Bacteroidia bacterium]
MHSQVKKYVSIFFLFLFLFPTIEKQVHAFEHSADSHCTATDKHFHTLEHSCSICDFTITDSNQAPETEIQFIISANHFSYHPFIESVNIPDAFQNLPSRAPPIA